MTGGNTSNAKLNTLPQSFLKILQNTKTLEFLDLRRDYEIYAKKKTINLKPNP